MGGVGIWCMHFIGNRAIVLANGEIDEQIVYSSLFTAVSFFLPIVVLLGAFYILGASGKATPYYIALSGLLTGLAVCGMHYVGQLGISNYLCSYQVAFVAGAAVIAVFASIVALSVFFRLRETWTNSWWKRGMCGSVLGCAVSGMHWTATAGTSYKFKGRANAAAGQLSRTQTVIVCTVLSCAACVLLLIFALIASRSRKRSRNRAQQLVLACAYFDENGRIMVTPEGLLPSRKITNHYVEKTFGDEEFSRTHPAFLWIFRATRNWGALGDLVDGMKQHLASNPSARRYVPGNSQPSDQGMESDLDFSMVFKELFCAAAQDLASHVHQPLDKLGVLFEEPIETGRYPNNPNLFKEKITSKEDIESADLSYYFGKGQYMFVVRQIKKAEVNHFASIGFRFAGISQVAEILAKNMQIAHEHMQVRLNNMLTYSRTENLMTSGVHLACFMVRPNIHKGFDVLASADKPNQLPTMKLPFESLGQWQADILRRMDNWTVASMLKFLKGNCGYTMQYEVEFVREFHKALTLLVDLIEDPAIMQSKFSARRIMAPCQSASSTSPSAHSSSLGPGKCTILSIRLITNIQARTPNVRLTYVPLRFFNAQQQVYSGAADHEAFARQIHREFAHCSDLSRTKSEEAATEDSTKTITTTHNNNQHNHTHPHSQTPPPSSPLPRLPLPLFSFRGSSRKDSSLLKKPQKVALAEKPLVTNPAFGGIMVSNQVSVDISELQTRGSESSFEMNEMGTVGEVGVASLEMSTFVDELFALCRS
ncbi:MAG: hypothetical protein Q9160_002640 [Pyrenula sp. 1 TL-2023]